MKKVLLLSILFGATGMYAQNIGINATGTSPDGSAMLDIESPDKGMLIPRVALVATNNATPVTSPATSLLVYNTAAAGSGTTAVTPGFYYWNGTGWEKMITGNTVSTTDDQNLTGASLSGTTLQIDIENGSSATVNLAGLQDGTGTDSQTLTLTGSNLAISGGNSVTLIDNVNDADFVIGNEYNTGASLSGTTLSITDGGGAQTVNLSALQDHDWYKATTTAHATTITDYIYTNGNVGIGINNPDRNLHLFKDTGDVRIKIVADPSNSAVGENWNPAVTFHQDGYLIESYIGLIHSSGLGNRIAFNNPVEGLTSGSNTLLLLSNALGSSGGGSSAINFGIDDTVAMVISNNRKVGIGVSNPIAQLDILNKDNQEGIRISNNGYDGDNLNLGITFVNSGTDAGSQGSFNIYHSGVSSREGIEFWGYPSDNTPTCCNRVATFKNNGDASFTNNLGIGTDSPVASAKLEVNSTTKGVLFPRMSEAQKNAIAAPATGLLVYQLNSTNGFYYYDGTQWVFLGGGGSSSANSLVYTADGF